MSFFGHGNPLTSQVGQLIEQATDPNLASENWSLNMEICDVINESDDGPKDAVKAMKKRIQQFVGKNYNSVMYTLTILETCVKNCGKRFHIHIANKDFLHDLIKIIGPKNDPPQVVQEKVLSLIQTWADAFRGSPELKEVEKVYLDLKSKGIEFPMTDLDHMAPIHTPARSAPDPPPSSVPVYPVGPPPFPVTVPPYPAASSPQPVHPVGVVPPQPMTMQPPGPVAASGEQISKLKRELDIVQGNYRVLAEMLTELNPTDIDQSNLELLQDLHRTCKHMQTRLVDLLESVSNEEVTVELLHINDDLNNIFLRYERFDRRRTGQTVTTPGESISEEDATSTTLHPPPPSYDQLQEAANPNVGNLIDLGNDSSQSSQAVDPNNIQVGISNISLEPSNTQAPATIPDETEFDMFAQSRQSFDQSKQSLGSGQSYKDQQSDQIQGGLGTAVKARSNNLSATPELQVVDKVSEYDEMESWLTKNDPNGTASEGVEPITSSEFDRFLASRAAAIDQLPDINAATGQQPPQRGGNRPTRQLQKDEEENTLFAL